MDESKDGLEQFAGSVANIPSVSKETITAIDFAHFRSSLVSNAYNCKSLLEAKLYRIDDSTIKHVDDKELDRHWPPLDRSLSGLFEVLGDSDRFRRLVEKLVSQYPELDDVGLRKAMAGIEEALVPIFPLVQKCGRGVKPLVPHGEDEKSAWLSALLEFSSNFLDKYNALANVFQDPALDRSSWVTRIRPTIDVITTLV